MSSDLPISPLNSAQNILFSWIFSLYISTRGTLFAVNERKYFSFNLNWKVSAFKDYQYKCKKKVIIYSKMHWGKCRVFSKYRQLVYILSSKASSSIIKSRNNLWGFALSWTKCLHRKLTTGQMQLPSLPSLNKEVSYFRG